MPKNFFMKSDCSINSGDNESVLNENLENEENLTTDNQDLDLASKKENPELPENAVSE